MKTAPIFILMVFIVGCENCEHAPPLNVVMFYAGLEYRVPYQQSAPVPKPQGATVRVAAIKFISDFGNADKNVARLIPLITNAAEKGAKIVVLPEASITGYATFDNKTVWGIDGRRIPAGKKVVSPAIVAEDIDGPNVHELCNLAGDLGIYLTIPFVEVDRTTGKYYNATILAGPDGEELLEYRKINPWPPLEMCWATKGDRGHQYVDTPYGRLGLLTCYDVLFEQLAMRNAHVTILLYSAAWGEPITNKWFDRGLPVVARANGFHIVAANWTVPQEPEWHGYGQSEIIANDGTIKARVKNNLATEIIYADLTLTN